MRSLRSCLFSGIEESSRSRLRKDLSTSSQPRSPLPRVKQSLLSKQVSSRRKKTSGSLTWTGLYSAVKMGMWWLARAISTCLLISARHQYLRRPSSNLNRTTILQVSESSKENLMSFLVLISSSESQYKHLRLQRLLQLQTKNPLVQPRSPWHHQLWLNLELLLFWQLRYQAPLGIVTNRLEMHHGWVGNNR